MLYRLSRRLSDLRSRWHRFLRGYAWVDVWDLDIWFIETVEPMLRHLQKNGVGTPCGYEDDEWKDRLGQMADHLHLMGEWNVIDEVFDGDYMNTGINDVMREHKDKFFKMFSEDFYNLWD